MSDTSSEGGSERRREARVALEMPVRVTGYERDGTCWEELTEALDASLGGVSLLLRHEVGLGRVLRLVGPFPADLRRFDNEAPAYEVYALVRHAVPGDGEWRLGLRILGKVAPKGFEKRPWTRYRLPSDARAEAGKPPAAKPAAQEPPPEDTTPPTGVRRFERFEIFVGFMITPLDEKGFPCQGELGVSENISRGGARLKTGLELESGQYVHLKDTDSDFESKAEVRHTFIGPDGVRRINVMFLGGEGPVHLLGKS
jgi:hypothetical protein